jgi:hypothetical protein
LWDVLVASEGHVILAVHIGPSKFLREVFRLDVLMRPLAQDFFTAYGLPVGLLRATGSVPAGSGSDDRGCESAEREEGIHNGRG